VVKYNLEKIYTFAAKNLALQGKDGQWPLKYYPNLNTPAFRPGMMERVY
jgi:hypothetical protein